ncbi:TetR/AcrR family transcriptional regulator [Archangium violaceum]|uniref:TetR/AcrR family transcriptional regulator n=1 Tax=Archangium violaceum TaxID=83451 RepID=UPI00195221FA|nr:TetR/AcrR family transcriptional regulator [Archangium violaceum]QRO01082.1 TetR/AcrR family transcriptional regulator [Archangium violaceum]
MSTGRAQQKEETRLRVLKAARRHFEEHGFDEANLRAIAAEANVSAATVIVHFKDKKELLHAALFDDLEETIERALRELPEAELETQLHAITESFFGYYQAHPKLSRTLLKESLFAEPPWAQRFSGQVTKVHARIAGLYQAAAAKAGVDSAAEAPLFAVAYLSFYYFALIAWAQGANDAPVRMVDGLVAQHLRGLLPRTPDRRTRR